MLAEGVVDPEEEEVEEVEEGVAAMEEGAMEERMEGMDMVRPALGEHQWADHLRSNGVKAILICLAKKPKFFRGLWRWLRRCLWHTTSAA